MGYNTELAQDMINYLVYITSKRDYEVGQLVNLLAKEFANEKGMSWTTGEDPISQYPEETEDAFDSIGMYRIFLDWRKQTLGESNVMKITRKQLRKLVKEALDPNANQQEAAYAVIYTAGYLDASDRELGQLINKNPKLGNQGDKWVPLDDAFGNVHSVLIGGASSIKRENPELDLSEENSILQEGQAAGQADFRESIYKYIEQVEVLVNRQTPMGMSAAEGLRAFGIEGGGVLMGDTAAGDARDLIALMNDDNVLSWLDEVETMGRYGELQEMASPQKTKMVPTDTPSYDDSIKKGWTVMVNGERIGEIAKIDKIVRDGGHYSDGSSRVRGWQAYSMNRIMPNKTFAKRAPVESFRTKKEALDWLMKQ